MINFVKTIVNEFNEIEPYGDKYIVHLCPEPVDNGISCWECIINETPDLEFLNSELLNYLGFIENMKSTNSIKKRMKDILKELSDTDYLPLKDYEGEDMSAHEGWKEYRAALRQEYRELESQLNEL